MSRKSVNIRIVVSALIISALLFSGGLFVGYSINKEKLGDIEKRVLDVKRNIEDFQLQFLFLETLGERAACPLLSESLRRINKESFEIGERLTFFSSSSEVLDYEQYYELKKEYSRTLISYWLLASKLNDACSLGANTILYFYSKNCQTCDNQGFILTYLKNKYNEKVLVFALDSDLDEPGISTLKKFYGVTEYPSLVINNALFSEFEELSEIEEKIRP